MKVKYDRDAIKLKRAHESDAGLDIACPITTVVEAHSFAMIPTGVHIELPIDTVGLIFPRSSLFKLGIDNSGVIDTGYTGEIGVTIHNHSDYPYYIERGDRIAQLIIMPILRPELEEVKQLERTERGDNGYGSTGV